MRLAFTRFAVAGAACLMASVASAQDVDGQTPPTAAPVAPPPAMSAGQVQTAPPPAAAPAPAPQGPAPEAVNIAPPVAVPSPQGQWVYTQQYGWLFMPYARSYTYAPVNGGDPYMYVYYPNYGWRWVGAPWLIGIGARPWFGRAGWAGFGWYGHPWFGHPWYGWRGGYPGWYHGRWARPGPHWYGHPHYGHRRW